MKIIKQIDCQFFETMRDFILQSIYELERQNIPHKEIRVYVPNYLLEMYNRWRVTSDFSYNALNEICGINVIDNWDNTVVVDYEGRWHREEDFKPKILPVFGNEA